MHAEAAKRGKQQQACRGQRYGRNRDEVLAVLHAVIVTIQGLQIDHPPVPDRGAAEVAKQGVGDGKSTVESEALKLPSSRL